MKIEKEKERRKTTMQDNFECVLHKHTNEKTATEIMSPKETKDRYRNRI